MRIPSENDKAVYEAVKQYEGSMSAAVKHVAMERGYKVPSVYGMVNRVQKWLDSFDQDEAPAAPLDIVPQGQALRGVSSYVDADGNILRQWIKTDKAQESWAALIDAALEKASTLEPWRPAMYAKSSEMTTGLTFYPVADLHIGIKSALDSGWTLDAAISTYAAAFVSLISRSSPTEHAIIAFLGDLTHTDNDTNATPRSGKKLDVTGSYTEIVEAAMTLVCAIIETVAKWHKNVDVYYLAGNHDGATAVVMQAALKRLYQNDKRIDVHSSGVFAYHTYGANLIGMYHGHSAKLDDLPSVMAADQPVLWGQTTNRVFHVGHFHHRTVKEYRGCTVEIHRSPAPRDAWHEDSSYRSGRGIVSICYDGSGEIARSVVNL